MNSPRTPGRASGPALFAVCLALAGPSASAQQQETSGAVQVSPGLTRKSILRGIEGSVGRFEVRTRIDMGAAGVPGLEFTLTGTSDSQLLLDGEGILTRTELDGVETLTFLGARNDSGKLFNLTLDGARTAMTYSEGDVTGEGALVLSDPYRTFRTATMFVEEGGTLTKLFVGPDWKELAETRAVRVDGEPRDVLGALLNREVTPDQVNRNDEDPDPARNYAPEHALLANLVGDFTVESGAGESGAAKPGGDQHGAREPDAGAPAVRFRRTRLVGNGRYLLSVSGPSGPWSRDDSQDGGDVPADRAPALGQVDQLTVIGFDSVRRVYQLFRVSGADGPVHYCEGAPRADGELLLRDLVGGLMVRVTPGENGVQRWEWTAGRSAPAAVRLRPVSTAPAPGR